jgi:hypothetical protein
MMFLNVIENEPLRAEIFGGFALHGIARQFDKTRNAVADRKALGATDATQFPGADFALDLLRHRHIQIAAAARAGQEWKQSFFHAGLSRAGIVTGGRW